MASPLAGASMALFADQNYREEHRVRTLVTAALALAALTATAFAEPAAGPVELTNLQMDQLAAGQARNTVNIDVSSSVRVNVNNVRINVVGNRVVVRGARARVIRRNNTTIVRVVRGGSRVNIVLRNPPG